MGEGGRLATVLKEKSEINKLRSPTKDPYQLCKGTIIASNYWQSRSNCIQCISYSILR